MSRALAIAAKMREDYLHSPVDDLESCFWVALWSVLFNKDHEELLSTRECAMRESLARTNKSEAAYYLGSLVPPKQLSNIMQRFQSTLRAWWGKVRDRSHVWEDEVLVNSPEGAGKEHYLPHFHHFALQGVVDVLEVMAEH